ncbi:Gfo/Idh/MocA family protein [Nonomuraea spiralis]|uniref:Gfo/Idh/MocA family protein n=1 Tax=Nonomuraea TaxID=83681 RepID=UPI000F78D137|nr:Gfo/Idh/MocA family oxidoreductase [Nonomuraea sp. WAC 01424]RSN15559.1 gfo/Idh/MocA family oxidoreductase [Nonomuraea sp. WAC 01424]
MNPVRIGLMTYAHVHAPMYCRLLQSLPGVELVGLADDDARRADEAAKAHGLRTYETYDELLAADLDAVIVCSENTRHRGHVELAARAGVQILCEKPLATDVDDAVAMVRTCREHDVPLMTAFPMRYSAPIHELRTLLESGAVGTIRGCEGVNQGQLPRHRRNWFVDPELAGGGALIDHTVHVADALRFILADEVTEVYAQANDLVGGPDIAVETSGLVMLTFTSGVVATIDFSWNRPMSFPAWGGLGLRLVATSGVVDVDAYAERVTSYDDATQKVSWLDASEGSYRAMIENFVASVRTRTQVSATGIDGLRAVEIVACAYESLRTGQPVACRPRTV